MSLGNMIRDGLAGFWGRSIHDILINCQIDLQKGCTHLHSHKQCRSVPFAPHLHQLMLFYIKLSIGLSKSVKNCIVIFRRIVLKMATFTMLNLLIHKLGRLWYLLQFLLSKTWNFYHLCQSLALLKLPWDILYYLWLTWSVISLIYFSSFFYNLYIAGLLIFWINFVSRHCAVGVYLCRNFLVECLGSIMYIT